MFEITSDALTNAESMLRQTMHVCVASDTQMIQSFDWFKWRFVFPTKCMNLRYIIRYNVILANQKNEPCVYHWLRALAMFDAARSPAFVGATDMISSVLLIRKLMLTSDFLQCY